MLALTVFLGLVFDFVNGFHDTANSIATPLATKAFSPRTAFTVATAMNFLGALSFSGVAENLVADLYPALAGETGLRIIAASLIAATAWNIITWSAGLPSSSSHALFGSLAGALSGATGNLALVSGIRESVVSLAASPPLAFLLGYGVMSFLRTLFLSGFLAGRDNSFRSLQKIAATLQSFGHGSNDAQKTMGILTLALIASGHYESTQVPLWVKGSCSLVIALGTAAGGWRIIRTVASGITRLFPASGFSADVSSALTILSATLLHLPASTTHIISSSVAGVGAAGGRKEVNWRTFLLILSAWIFTLPVTVLTGRLFYLTLCNF